MTMIAVQCFMNESIVITLTTEIQADYINFFFLINEGYSTRGLIK